MAIAQVFGVSVEYLITGKEIKRKTVIYPAEARIVTEVTSQMEERNRRMVITVIKSMKKQEKEETNGK
ncbi:MAG: hypothetical protein LBQ89_06910 [Treponema sp.]|nr:hypothetical protein [Treponema sp.]